MKKKQPTLRNPECCPKCKHEKMRTVIDSRRRKGGYRRRLMLCQNCGEMWATFESLVDPKAIVKSLPEWARDTYLE